MNAMLPGDWKRIYQHIRIIKESTVVVAGEISARNMAQTATTLTVANLTTEPQAKKSKTERITVVKDDG